MLAAARARVNEGQNKSLGEAVSALALAGLASTTESRGPSDGGLVLLPSTPGHVITGDMVAEAMLDE
ncbi:hypothetical protein [Nocardioides sambongensis]|uniref:hypothetical protein n=1 Tax=Nocardioides sambongensis TaxID=2589074 RepID=UPI001E3E08EA|nr:hypothetical protein [Nocardioides sambongensis]